MKIALLANLKEDAPASPEDPPGRWDDLDDLLTVETTLRSLSELGHETRYFPGVFNSIEEIKAFKPDLCFNTSEGHYADSREAQIPAVLDMLRIPYTAAGVLGMMLSHNKHVAKNQFLQAGLPTPKFMVVDDPKNIPESSLRYPMFVKPAFEGSSIGIPESALVKNYGELVQQINWLVETLHTLVLVEEYIEGREFTISILGDEALPVVELFSPVGFYSHTLKEQNLSEFYRECPAKITYMQTKEFQEIALQAKKALYLEDCCRMDLRIDNAGNPYILEVNPLPCMYPDPKQASFICAAYTAGYSYTDIVRRIVESACRRWQIS